MDTDNQLLERYVHDDSELAFRELVERHVNLVYSAALRESKGMLPWRKTSRRGFLLSSLGTLRS